MISKLHAVITEMEQDRSLDDPAQFYQRLEALDRLEACTLDDWLTDQVDDQDQPGSVERQSGAALYHRVKVISARLEAINHALYQAIRHDIQRGAGPERLRRWVPRSGPDGRVASQVRGDGYDALDVLINGVLQFVPPDGEIAELAAEMVFYQPTPARHIFDLLDRAALTNRDVLVDLGAGLGHVPLLTAICTSASSIGIELEAAYVDCARCSARELNLTNVTFIQQDARAADLSTGTVFYLYTPFTGTILRTVLESLQHEATRHKIRIATLGPCTPIVAGESWLEAVEAPQTDQIALFRSSI